MLVKLELRYCKRWGLYWGKSGKEWFEIYIIDFKWITLLWLENCNSKLCKIRFFKRNEINCERNFESRF